MCTQICIILIVFPIFNVFKDTALLLFILLMYTYDEMKYVYDVHVFKCSAIHAIFEKPVIVSNI